MEQSNIVRPTLLKVLLILSFIGSSWNMFSGLSNALSEPSIERVESFMLIMEEVQIEDDNGETEEMIAQIVDFVSTINQNIVNFGAVEFMLYAISVIGIYLMYKNQRIGFRIYLTVQLLLLGSPIYFGGYSMFSMSLTVFYGFITMVFLALYSTQLKYLTS
jgi:hypothetical protein